MVEFYVVWRALVVLRVGCGRLGFDAEPARGDGPMSDARAWPDAGIDALPVAISYVQRAEVSNAASSAVVTTAPFAAMSTRNNTILCSIAYRSTTAVVIRFTDLAGNRYERAIGPFRSAGALAEWSYEIWYSTIGNPGTTPLTVTATLDAPAAARVVSCHEYTGIASAPAVSVTAAMTFLGADVFSLGPLQPESANKLLFVHWSSRISPSVSAFWTRRSGLAGDLYVDKIVSSADPQLATASCLADCTGVAVLFHGQQ